MNESIHCPFCSSVYEDAPYNYLIDYSIVNGGIPNVPVFAQLLGLNAAGETIFFYRYPATNCGKIYRAIPDSSGKYEVSDSRTSSAQPLYPGARFDR